MHCTIAVRQLLRLQKIMSSLLRSAIALFALAICTNTGLQLLGNNERSFKRYSAFMFKQLYSAHARISENRGEEMSSLKWALCLR